MRATRLKIENILGIEDLEIELGQITEISGSNGSGKTSVIEAIKAVLGGAKDATLVRNGADKGDSILLLEDGVTLRATIPASGSGAKTTVTHPTFGKLSRPAEFIKDLSDGLSVNPVAFINAKPKDRMAVLLSAIPMEVTAAELSFLPVAFLPQSLDGHALDVLEEIRRTVYNARTDVNRSFKDKATTSKQLFDSLPSGISDDWTAKLKWLEDDLERLNSETRLNLDGFRAAAAAEIEQLKTAYQKNRDEVIQRRDAEIERIRKAADDVMIASAAVIADDLERLTQQHQKAEAELRADYEPQRDELTKKIEAAKTKADEAVRAQETVKLAEQMGRDAAELEILAGGLTTQLDKLDALRKSKTAELPIQGLEVKDGEIYLDGVPFDRVNESRRVRAAIEVARLRAGKLGLVAVDGLECMDSRTFAEFERAARDSGLQFVISRVSDGPLAVSSSPVAEVRNV